MTVSFYMDEHIHSSISLGLRLRVVDVLIVQEDGNSGISDVGAVLNLVSNWLFASYFSHPRINSLH